LRRHKITVEIGRVKNVNKNPVAEKCIAELGDELLRVSPEGGAVSPVTLAIAKANLNTRIRERGVYLPVRCGTSVTSLRIRNFPSPTYT
jgi:hypothetical protein